MRNTTLKLAVTCITATLTLVACGGGSNAAAIGGTVSGLASGQSVILQDNNANDLTMVGNVAFSFSQTIGSGGAYNVSVLSQPVGQNCTVANGSGTVDGAGDPVSNVAVTCAYTSSVGGVVSGLGAGMGVTLQRGDGVTVAVAQNGTFAFPGLLLAGSNYDVTVSTQPAGQTCTVSNPIGMAVDSVMASVSVTCAP